MSLFKYGNLEAEIDFTDADFLDRIDEAKQNLEEDMKGIPKTGKAADIVRAQCQCFFNFFDCILGEGTHEEMFQGRTSLNMCIDASDMIAKFEEEEADKLNKKYGFKYQALCSYELQFKFTTDAGCLSYLDGKCFKAKAPDFVKMFGGNIKL